MYGGRIVEQGPAIAMFEDPQHPYTVGLLNATPRLADRRERLNSIEGTPPHLLAEPPGCSFAPRCGAATERCIRHDPVLSATVAERAVACWHPQDAQDRRTCGERGAPLDA